MRISTEFQVLAIKLLAELLTSFVQSRSLSPEEDRGAGLLKEADAFVKKWEGVEEDESSEPIVPPTVIVQEPPKKKKNWRDNFWW